MAKMKIKLDRANLGNSLDLAEHYWDLHQAGLSWTDAASQIVAEKAVERYQGHLVAAFNRYGIPLGDDGVITVEVLRQTIENRTGMQISSLTPDSVLQAVDGQMSRELSDYLGVELTTVTNAGAIKAALIESAKQAVVSGRATKLISKAMIRQARKVKTFKAQGVDTNDRDKLLNRAYQKKYRQRFKEVWIGSKNDPGFDQDMYGYPRDL